ncbi:methyltransferase, FxLD system [Dactylosporangium cerinum]|uniref:Protein-L-isoaspartate O-methyltransferase n=1 Tax=Dactylosporangium cerinum TaxID=1434730 RepID=A0ABV9WJX7_9ACTN
MADEPTRLRHVLVRTLVDAGWLTEPRVAAALRTVPRHRFVPGVPVLQAYANDVVQTKFDVDGRPISAASQPRIVAAMLQQAGVRAGDRVLEIGLGTGYNAALLAELTGPDGRVTSIDVDADIVDAAAANLAATGYASVQVVCGDGALGHPPAAPFDVVIATVAAWDVPAAWLEQIAEGGRLVVPQRIRGGITRSVVYQRDAAGRWVSADHQMCGFMPLRGGVADDPQRSHDLTGDGRVRLDVYQEQHVDTAALAGVLDQPRTQIRTGVRFDDDESLEWLWLWLACALPGGLGTLHAGRVARNAGLVVAPYGIWLMATTDHGTLAYTTAVDPGAGGDGIEIAVVGHGRQGQALAERLAAEVVRWDRRARSLDVRLTLEPNAAPDTAGDVDQGRFVFTLPSGLLTVRWLDDAT